VGFYLDDWLALCLLHFAPKEGGYIGLLHYYLFSDGRVLIRPLEAIHFATVFYFCHDKPFGWHFVNFVFEVASALALYGVFLRLTGLRATAFCGALLLLLYPSHDSTHYWVVCSSVALSLTLYLASLRASVAATDLYFAGSKSSSAAWQLLSFILFLASLLNYETFLPLAALSVVACTALAYRQTNQAKKALLQGAFAALPMILGVVALLLFLKLIVPALGHGYSHAFKLDASVMLSTVGRGLILNAPPETLSFFFAQAQNAVTNLSASEIMRLVALLAVSAMVVVYLARLDKGDFGQAQMDRSVCLKPIDLLILGLVTITVSYTIFGLSSEYSPTFVTMVNRINTGASLGVALILVALCQAFESFARARQFVYVAPLAIGTAAFVLLFVLADWGLSKPWIASWTTQKEVRKAVSQLKGKIDKNASLLLVNCPGYVMWSPVFDGVWDFQNMARITLELPNFNANVVSERMSLSDQGLKDVSYGFDCGSYPFDKLYLMVAPRSELFAVQNPGQFVDLVEHRGMTFGLNEKTLSKWKQSVE
jgi:hypothetical protein